MIFVNSQVYLILFAPFQGSLVFGKIYLVLALSPCLYLKPLLIFSFSYNCIILLTFVSVYSDFIEIKQIFKSLHSILLNFEVDMDV